MEAIGFFVLLDLIKNTWDFFFLGLLRIESVDDEVLSAGNLVSGSTPSGRICFDVAIKSRPPNCD